MNPGSVHDAMLALMRPLAWRQVPPALGTTPPGLTSPATTAAQVVLDLRGVDELVGVLVCLAELAVDGLLSRCRGNSRDDDPILAAAAAVVLERAVLAHHDATAPEVTDDLIRRLIDGDFSD